MTDAQPFIGITYSNIDIPLLTNHYIRRVPILKKNCKFDGQSILYFTVELVDSPLLAQATFVTWGDRYIYKIIFMCHNCHSQGSKLKGKRSQEDLQNKMRFSQAVVLNYCANIDVCIFTDGCEFDFNNKKTISSKFYFKIINMV